MNRKKFIVQSRQCPIPASQIKKDFYQWEFDLYE